MQNNSNATKLCSACGQVMPLSGKFCPRCGLDSLKVQYCSICASPLSPGQVFCLNCGAKSDIRSSGNRQAQAIPSSAASSGLISRPAGSHSVVIAVLLSLFCGFIFAMFYNGQWQKAIAMFFGGFVMGVLNLILGISTSFDTGVQIAIYALGLLIWITLVIDSIAIASRLNRGEIVSQWDWFGG